MKRFIQKSIYTILPILIAAIFMEVLLRKIPNDYLLKKSYLDEHATEIENLILGSSHSFYGLNPEFFSNKTFNASHISQSLNYDLEILKKYQSNFNNLTNIILPISYFILYGKLEEGTESWRVKNYVIYYDMNSANSIINHYEFLSNRTDVNLNRLSSYYFFGKSQVSCTELGWGSNYKSGNARDLVKSGKTASKRHTYDSLNSEKYQGILKDNKLILDSIIKWSHERNIKILLFIPPAFVTYRQNLNIAQLNTTIEITSKSCSKYDNCAFVNLLSDTSFIAKDFYDADHLSEIGAEKLSKLINEKIID